MDRKLEILPHGSVVDGEASESEDETVFSSDFQTSAIQSQNKSSGFKRNEHRFSYSKYSDSLLAKKLYTGNLFLWNHLVTFSQTTAESALKQIILADKLLLKSQFAIQSASTSIKKINKNSVEILDQYKYLLTGNFIPKIKI